MRKAAATAMMCFAATVFVVAGVMMGAGAAMAQSGSACVYANDDVPSYPDNPNTVDGYLVTTTSQSYISPFQTGGQSKGISQISDIVVNPTKSFLYAADSQTGDIAAMKINPTTCQLTLLGNFSVGRGNGLGLGLAISPNGKWIYAAGVKSAELNVLAVQNDGGLSKIRQTIPLLNRPSSMAVSPDNATLIVGIPARPGNGEELISYSINPSTGLLTQVSMVPPQGYPSSISIDSQSKFVYVDEPFGEYLRVGLLEIGAGSTLTFLRTFNFTAVGGSLSTGSGLLSVNGKYLYVTDSSIASVTTLVVNDLTGGLKYLSTASYGIINEDRPVGLATSKNGAFVFAGEPDVGYITHMGIFAAGRDGSLTSLGTFPISETYPAWVAAK